MGVGRKRHGVSRDSGEKRRREANSSKGHLYAVPGKAVPTLTRGCRICQHAREEEEVPLGRYGEVLRHRNQRHKIKGQRKNGIGGGKKRT